MKSVAIGIAFVVAALAGGALWLWLSLCESSDCIGWPALLVGGPLAFAGFVLRRRARRKLDALDRILATRRSLRDVAPGLACVSGRWRALDDRRGLVADDGGAALVVFAPGHEGAAPADGTDVIAYGLGGGLVDDPRGAGYRNDTRLPQLAIVDAGHFVRPAAYSLERAVAGAQRIASLGAVTFALGVGVVAMAVVIALRVFALSGLE
jgi:hypothetical protein